MEQQIKKVLHGQEQFAQQTEKRFAAAELREKQHQQQVATAMDNVKTELATSLDGAFQKNNKLMEDRLLELKQLLQASHKRPLTGDGSMED